MWIVSKRHPVRQRPGEIFADGRRGDVNDVGRLGVPANAEPVSMPAALGGCDGRKKMEAKVDWQVEGFRLVLKRRGKMRPTSNE